MENAAAKTSVQPVVEADDTLYDEDVDSTIGEEDEFSSTASIQTSIYRSRQENGRTYHSYKDGKYILPNDERENERQDLQNHLCLLTFENKLALAPLGKLNRVLDVGTGTGAWAMDFADEHPEAEIIGVDLSANQPLFVPPNLRFEIDDLEETWTFRHKFDYIHSRMMMGAFRDWPKYYQQVFDNLESGGIFESQETGFPIACDDGTMKKSSALYQWSISVNNAAKKLGFPIDTANTTKQSLKDFGFVDVVEKRFMWPMNRWPKEKKYKILGTWTQENFVSGIEAMCMALLTRGLGWSAEEVTTVTDQVKKDMMNTSIHAYWNVYVVYGRKP